MVPTAEVAPILKRALIERYGENYESLASGSSPRVLHRWMHEQDWAEFDAVDRIYAQLWLVPEVWRDKLPHLYHGITLKEVSRAAPRRCARRGCSEAVGKNPRGRQKKYCSPACRSTDGSRRRDGGYKVRPYGKTLEKGHHLTALECANGHALDDENTYVTSRGYRQCRICQRESSRAYAERKRDAARRVQRVS